MPAPVTAFLLRPACPPAVAAQLLRLRRARDHRPKYTQHNANCAADEAARDMCERFGFGTVPGSGEVWEAVTATLAAIPPPPANNEPGTSYNAEMRWYQAAIDDLKQRMDSLPCSWPWTTDPAAVQPVAVPVAPNVPV